MLSTDCKALKKPVGGKWKWDLREAMMQTRLRLLGQDMQDATYRREGIKILQGGQKKEPMLLGTTQSIILGLHEEELWDPEAK